MLLPTSYAATARFVEPLYGVSVDPLRIMRMMQLLPLVT
jgi:hypothetical protein